MTDAVPGFGECHSCETLASLYSTDLSCTTAACHGHAGGCCAACEEGGDVGNASFDACMCCHEMLVAYCEERSGAGFALGHDMSLRYDNTCS